MQKLISLAVAGVALFWSPFSLAISKGDARAELKAKHFIAYDSAEQFNKAFLDKNIEVVRLFFFSHNGFPDLEPSLNFSDAFPPDEESNAQTRYLSHAIEVGSLDILKMFVDIEHISGGDKRVAIHTAVRAGILLQDCRSDLVSYLYANDIKLEDGHSDDKTGADDFAKIAAGKNCDAIVSLLLTVHPRTAVPAMTAFTEKNQAEYKKDHSAAAPFWTPEFQTRFTATEKALKGANAAQCKPDSGLDSCRVLKEYDEFEKLIALGKLDLKAGAEKSKMEEEYKKTPEYHFNTACSQKDQKKASEAEIARQKKISSVSGVKDEKALYAAGEAVAAAEASINEHKAAYKKLTGKTLDLKKCK